MTLFQVDIPQIVGFKCAKKPTEWGISLITFNLRKRQFSFQVQIPQIVGFGFAQKYAK